MKGTEMDPILCWWVFTMVKDSSGYLSITPCCIVKWGNSFTFMTLTKLLFYILKMQSDTVFLQYTIDLILC